MQIGIDVSGQAELVERYRTAADTMRDVRFDLLGTLSEAADMLGQSTQRIKDELRDVEQELRLDAFDVEWRGDFLVEADRATAHRIAVQAGDLVNPFLAAKAQYQGWTYAEAQAKAELERLERLPTSEQVLRRQQIEHLKRMLWEIEAPHTATGRNGDADADLDDYRINPPLRLRAPSGTARGRDLLIRALDDTANQDIINQDEFQAIFHENGHLTIVLAGVVDLSNKLSDPTLRYDPEHRTYRDLDQEAYHSSKSTLLDDNGYGRRVRDWINLQVKLGNIEPGTPTTIIGHSYGGDTALDLAAHTEVNGRTLDIQFVISAGYENAPQYDDIPSKTQVVSMKNIYDVAVLAEAAGSDLHHDEAQFGEQIGSIALEGGEGVVNGITWLVNETMNEIEGSIEDVHGISIDVPEIPKFDPFKDRYTRPKGHILEIEFEGGIDGAGHHQDNYLNLIQHSVNEDLLLFYNDLDDAGFTADGTTVAIDVTKPETDD